MKNTLCHVCEENRDRLHDFPREPDIARAWAYSLEWTSKFDSYVSVIYRDGITIWENSRCSHGPVDCRKFYLDPITDAAQIATLEEMVNDRRFLESLKTVSPRHATSSLEIFHSMTTNIYLPKNHFFDKESSEHFMRLAVLHNNEYAIEKFKERQDRQVYAESFPTVRKFSRTRKQYFEYKQYERPTSDWKKSIVQGVRKSYANNGASF